MAIKEREKAFPINEMAKELKDDRGFKDGVLEGFEDYKNGRTELWSDVKKELDLER